MELSVYKALKNFIGKKTVNLLPCELCVESVKCKIQNVKMRSLEMKMSVYKAIKNFIGKKLRLSSLANFA